MIIIALGSNIHPREAHLRRAVELLERRVGRLSALSNFVETPPMGFDSPNLFLNGVAVFSSDLPVEEVLTATQQIERQLGRAEKSQNGVYADRTIDIDLLAATDRLGQPVLLDTPQLTLPHPRMEGRRFVLEPLAEVAPYFKHPLTGLTAEEMLARLNTPDIRRLVPADAADAALLEGINALLEQLSSRARPLDAPALKALLGTEGSSVYAAFDEFGTLAGLAALCFTLSPTGLKAWVEDVVVTPQARGRGYATALLERLIGKARERGAKSVNLTSRPERTTANKLYRKMGFRLRTTNVYRLELA